ncbi:hypothetical protein TIFTF001_041404 [Ficus carica]|uniref:Uncharacterized protein n=1 Tax=Ficus carica TaxID=3494 RepID=A0AA87Z8F7_FICCA|nr:hypothetical protein TIFTF001_041404 [Ficus carica]
MGFMYIIVASTSLMIPLSR